MKKYENQEIVDRADEVSNQILKEKHQNCYRDHFFPKMINTLNLRVGAEIGVDKAGFSERILSQTKIEKYFCVDTWQDNFGSDCRPGYFANEGNVRFNEAKEILRPYLGDFDNPHLDSGRAIMIRQLSTQAAPLIANDALDFCYIDGDHSLFGIYDDLFAWVPKVKIGGVLAGHDFKDGPRSGVVDYFGEQLDYKIKTVVENYCSKFGYKLNITGGLIRSWWFIKNR